MFIKAEKTTSFKNLNLFLWHLYFLILFLTSLSKSRDISDSPVIKNINPGIMGNIPPIIPRIIKNTPKDFLKTPVFIFILINHYLLSAKIVFYTII